jgi:hypothetical protein
VSDTGPDRVHGVGKRRLSFSSNDFSGKKKKEELFINFQPGGVESRRSKEFYMFSEKRKNGKKMFAALLLGSLLVFTLVGCDNGNGEPNNPYNPYNPYGDEGIGWPSSKLSTYGLGGMSQPSGMSNIEWWELEYYTGYDYPVIYITFSGTAATDTSIQQYFSGSGWTADGYSYGGTSGFTYTKGNTETYYMFSDGFGWIVSGHPTE